MNALTMSATRRRDKVVILSAIDLTASSSTSGNERLSRALSQISSSSLATLRIAKKWVKCNCAPGRLFRALFSARLSTAVAVVAITAMWWHNISIEDTIEAQKAVAFDCLYAMPWAIVWAVRATIKPMPEKGGEK